MWSFVRQSQHWQHTRQCRWRILAGELTLTITLHRAIIIRSLIYHMNLVGNNYNSSTRTECSLWYLGCEWAKKNEWMDLQLTVFVSSVYVVLRRILTSAALLITCTSSRWAVYTTSVKYKVQNKCKSRNVVSTQPALIPGQSLELTSKSRWLTSDEVIIMYLVIVMIIGYCIFYLHET